MMNWGENEQDRNHKFSRCNFPSENKTNITLAIDIIIILYHHQYTIDLIMKLYGDDTKRIPMSTINNKSYQQNVGRF